MISPVVTVQGAVLHTQGRLAGPLLQQSNHQSILLENTTFIIIIICFVNILSAGWMKDFGRPYAPLF